MLFKKLLSFSLLFICLYLFFLINSRSGDESNEKSGSLNREVASTQYDSTEIEKIIDKGSKSRRRYFAPTFNKSSHKRKQSVLELTGTYRASSEDTLYALKAEIEKKYLIKNTIESVVNISTTYRNEPCDSRVEIFLYSQKNDFIKKIEPIQKSVGQYQFSLDLKKIVSSEIILRIVSSRDNGTEEDRIFSTFLIPILEKVVSDFEIIDDSLTSKGEIVFSFNLSVKEESEYLIEGELYLNGRKISIYKKRHHLKPGDNNTSIIFPGKYFSQVRDSGVFEFRRVAISRASELGEVKDLYYLTKDYVIEKNNSSPISESFLLQKY